MTNIINAFSARMADAASASVITQQIVQSMIINRTGVANL
jgi:hypothetical protein